MKTEDVRSLRTITCMVTFLLALVVSLLPGVPMAMAGMPACQYDGSTHRVTLTATAESEELRLRRNGNEIEFTGSRRYRSCDGATVNNTDRVDFVDETTERDAHLFISAPRRFEPGHTNERAGKSEIEFVLDMGHEQINLYYTDDCVITGTEGDDTIIAGTEGLNVNADSDVDLRYQGLPERCGIFALAGSDRVFMDGRRGAGEFTSSQFSHMSYGGDGRDLLMGGAARDYFDGTEHQDILWGKGGEDFLQGGDRRDHIIGGDDADKVQGQHGPDHLEGSAGDDRLRGGWGPDHLDGDAGDDFCNGGRGTNTFEDCEGRP